MKIHECEQGTPEWLELRKGLITASEASKLVSSTCKVSTQAEGYAEILAAELAGAKSEYFESYDMKQGKIREPSARAKYSLEYGPVHEIGFITDDNGLYGFSPDLGIKRDGKFVAGGEIKCRKLKNFLEIIKSPIPVIADQPQVQFGLWITGWEFIDQVWYFPGLPIHVQRWEPNYDFFELFEIQAEKCISHRDEFFSTYFSNSIKEIAQKEVEELGPEIEF